MCGFSGQALGHEHSLPLLEPLTIIPNHCPKKLWVYRLGNGPNVVPAVWGSVPSTHIRALDTTTSDLSMSSERTK